MIDESSRIEHLFPSARELFQQPGRTDEAQTRAPLRPFAWVVAGAVAVLIGQQLASWADRHL